MRNLGNTRSIASCHFQNMDLAVNLADSTSRYFQKTWPIIIKKCPHLLRIYGSNIWHYLSASWLTDFMAPLATIIGSLLPANLPVNLYVLRASSHWIQINPLTLPMLRLLSPRVQGCKDFYKQSKPCHIGFHWIALTEYSQMSTHFPGFQTFFSFFASFCIGQISHQQATGPLMCLERFCLRKAMFPYD